MRRLLDIVRPIGLVGAATTIFVSLLWVHLLWLDEFASKFILSEKVLGLHRLITVLLVVQWLIMMLLIWALERVIAKRRKTTKANQTVQATAAKLSS